MKFYTLILLLFLCSLLQVFGYPGRHGRRSSGIQLEMKSGHGQKRVGPEKMIPGKMDSGKLGLGKLGTRRGRPEGSSKSTGVRSNDDYLAATSDTSKEITNELKDAYNLLVASNEIGEASLVVLQKDAAALERINKNIGRVGEGIQTGDKKLTRIRKNSCCVIS